ncbi:hypothetical protein [Henriciella sp.]|uniref:CC0125/CC1285 family lipoprotein n=1 Tax=Henriciella sp. TaxID=1968823 RepID=UPI0026051F51|nr:hypothetical protein [Henriciella sp.]
MRSSFRQGLQGLALAAFMSVTACQTLDPTPYQARAEGNGYSETALGEGIYRVSFEGNTSTPYQTVEDYLLYRAAELARENGAQTFTILRNDQPSTFVESRPEHTVCHYSPADFSEFVFYPNETESKTVEPPKTSYEAYIDVKLGKPPAGAADAQVFRTDETLQYLAPCISGAGQQGIPG